MTREQRATNTRRTRRSSRPHIRREPVKNLPNIPPRDQDRRSRRGVQERGEWTAVGENMFSCTELQAQRRIEYGCVIVDNYVGTPSGRPVAIADRAFDMKLPPDEDSEEVERGRSHRAPSFVDDPADSRHGKVPSTTGRAFSCFSQQTKHCTHQSLSTSLSSSTDVSTAIMLCQIHQSVCAIKAIASRPAARPTKRLWPAGAPALRPVAEFAAVHTDLPTDLHAASSRCCSGPCTWLYLRVRALSDQIALVSQRPALPGRG